MINKQNLWFVTLFSLILILGIYYISLPEDALTTFSSDNNSSLEAIEITESDVIVALKVEEEEKIIKEMEDYKKVLLDISASVDDKNKAYEALQLLNSKKGKILEIEKIIKEKYNVASCIKIDGNKINVILSMKDQGTQYANNVIKTIQELYDTQMYITVKFQEK